MKLTPPTPPTTQRNQYQYQIYISNDTEPSKIDSFINLAGKPTTKVQNGLIWLFEVSNIDDIYNLLLAKMHLVDDGFKLIYQYQIVDSNSYPYEIDVLQPLYVNQKPLNTYIRTTEAKMSEYKSLFIGVKKYVFNRYLFVEACIYLTYQNIIQPNRPFEDTCNSGISYFEFVLKTIDSQKDAQHQKDKTFPIRLPKQTATKKHQQSLIKANEVRQTKMTKRQKQILKLRNSGKYTNSQIAKKLKVSLRTINRDIKVLKSIGSLVTNNNSTINNSTINNLTDNNLTVNNLTDDNLTDTNNLTDTDLVTDDQTNNLTDTDTNNNLTVNHQTNGN